MALMKTFSTTKETVRQIEAIVKLTGKSQATILKEAIKDYYDKTLNKNQSEVEDVLNNLSK